MNDIGYTQHSECKCLFYSKKKNGFILLHVDDMGVLFKRDGIERNRVVTILEKKYETLKKQSENKVVYIGIEIEYIPVKNEYHLGMKDRILKLCKEYNVSVPVHTPADTRTFMLKQDNSNEECDVSEFRSLIAKIRYIVMRVFGEILFHVSWLSTKQRQELLQLSKSRQLVLI